MQYFTHALLKYKIKYNSKTAERIYVANLMKNKDHALGKKVHKATQI